MYKRGTNNKRGKDCRMMKKVDPVLQITIFIIVFLLGVFFYYGVDAAAQFFEGFWD
jgi:hypothetical protein